MGNIRPELTGSAERFTIGIRLMKPGRTPLDRRPINGCSHPKKEEIL